MENNGVIVQYSFQARSRQVEDGTPAEITVAHQVLPYVRPLQGATPTMEQSFAAIFSSIPSGAKVLGDVSEFANYAGKTFRYHDGRTEPLYLAIARSEWAEWRALTKVRIPERSKRTTDTE